ncbi:MAG: branched-chain amino acid ABC transporter permease, partial [Desulfotomaculaceae bacterium]
GLNNIGGAVLGGLLLGILESYSAGLISSGLKDGLAIIILLVVLMVKPHGILGLLGERKI